MVVFVAMLLFVIVRPIIFNLTAILPFESHVLCPSSRLPRPSKKQRPSSYTMVFIITYLCWVA